MYNVAIYHGDGEMVLVKEFKVVLIWNRRWRHNDDIAFAGEEDELSRQNSIGTPPLHPRPKQQTTSIRCLI